MNITIPYRRSHGARIAGYILSAAFLAAVTAFLFRIGTPASLGCAIFSLLLLLLPLWLTVQSLCRAALKTGCFSVTSDGLENIVHLLLVGCFRVPVTVRLIPWSCIDSFRIDRTAGGESLTVMTKDVAEFPKGYSPFVRALLEREQNRCVCGLSVDTRFAAADPQELLRMLQLELEAFRRRGFPADRPGAPLPLSPEHADGE